MRNSLDFILSLTDLNQPVKAIKYNHYQMVLVVSEPEILSSLGFLDPQFINDPQSKDASIAQVLQKQEVIQNTRQKKKQKNGCVCKKTSCLKMYCECFAGGKLCNKECVCVKCCNIETNKIQLQNVRFIRKAKTNVNDNKCNCKKSNCKKKYCQCFNNGRQCGSQCNCCQCHNKTAKKQQCENQV